MLATTHLPKEQDNIYYLFIRLKSAFIVKKNYCLAKYFSW